MDKSITLQLHWTPGANDYRQLKAHLERVEPQLALQLLHQALRHDQALAGPAVGLGALGVSRDWEGDDETRSAPKLCTLPDAM
jgi:hypothetical protein